MAFPVKLTVEFRTNGMKVSMCCLLVGLGLVVAAPAEVVRLEVTGQRDLGANGYEELKGQLHFEVDPSLPSNAVVADIELAPRNAAGRVAFQADWRLLRPRDPARANGAAWVEIPNRGGQAGLADWVVAGGFTVMQVGWEFDVPAGQGKMRMEAPRARQPDGKPLRYLVRAVFTPDKRQEEQVLIDLAEYPPADLDGPDSRLVVRNRAAFAEGETLPRASWSLSEGRLRLQGGFEPGRTYEIFYLSENPPVAGLGYAAIRDAVAWLRHAEDSPARVRHVLTYGGSQCGRLLRDFLYLGFNTDEAGRQVFDGVLAHVAGAGRLVLNERGSTPRAVAGYHTSSYPFADTAQPDPVSGVSEGILDNPRVKHVPKVFYTNMAAEYWGAGRVAALIHTDPSGQRDLVLPDSVRTYFFAGTSHGAASFPPTAQVPGSPLANPVNANDCITALRAALHHWVVEGVEPPPSVHPKLADGSLVPVAEVKFPKVPGMAAPNHLSAGPRVANPRLSGGAGAGTELPLLVPQVDADGNDLGGIRMPDVAVPLGTATGWVLRPAELGSPHEPVLLRGAWVPFARTRAERAATQDPRPSLEERYASREEYLSRVRQCLQDLVDRRLLLAGDLEPQVRKAGARWDWVMNRSTP
jgi:hypothetical protein